MSESTSTPPEPNVNNSSPNDQNSTALSITPTLSALNPFTTHKPASIIGGIKRSLANVIAGAIGAVLLVIAIPVKVCIEGYGGYGIKGAVGGALGGCILGSISGAVMALAGAFTSLYQIGHGLYRTPAALFNSFQGKDWDDNTQNWITYDLSIDAKTTLNIDEGEFNQAIKDGNSIEKYLIAEFKQAKSQLLIGNKSNNDNENDISDRDKKDTHPIIKKNLKDRKLYDVLGLEPEANSSQIKKAYYIKARQYHPDRHQDDPNANENFQKIGEAYQVLSDERLRFIYDSKGQDALKETPKMDAGTLYTLIFGSENFEPIIGELQMSTQIQLLMDSEGTVDASMSPDYLALKQRKREILCALTLVSKLDLYQLNYNQDDDNVFIEKHTKDTEELSDSPLGCVLLSLIGSIYEDKAKAELNILVGLGVAAKNTSKSLLDIIDMVGISIKSVFSASALYRLHQKSAERIKEEEEEEESNENDEKTKNRDEEKSNKIKNMMPRPGKNATPEEIELFNNTMKNSTTNILTLVWHLTKMDIINTVNNICNKVLHDHSVTAIIRNKRAIALLKLGNIYSKKSKSSQEGIEDLLSKMGINKGHHEYKSSEEKDTNKNDEKKDDDDDDDDTWENVNPISKADRMIDILKEIPNLSVKELKKYIESLNGDHSSCIEKNDMKKILINLICNDLTIKELFEIINIFLDSDKLSTKVLDDCIKNNNKQFFIDVMMKSYKII